MLEPILTSITTKLFEEAFNQIKSQNITKINVSASIAINEAFKVEKVKTIWRSHSSISFLEFYYPSKINTGIESVPVTSLKDISSIKHLIIEGTVGQGKSIMLRKLASSALREAITIPIFIELMKVKSNTNLKSLLITSLCKYGICASEANLNELLSTGKFTLLLDAFDEVHESKMAETIDYIAELADEFPNIKIIITTRPSNNLKFLNSFKVVQIAKLKANEFPKVIDKLYSTIDDDLSSEIPNQLKKALVSKKKSYQFIDTPLLLTLLCITYNSYPKLPTSIHEFYKRLFSVLVEEHDFTKPGFTRKYQSGLNVHQLEKLFKAYSFMCAQVNGKSIPLDQAISNINKVSNNLNIRPVDSYKFLSDCKNNTCLLLEESGEIHFIHKSIMEYFSAAFINESSTTFKERLYNRVLKNQRTNHFFHEQLKYLSHIDDTHFNSHYLIPLLESDIAFLQENMDSHDSFNYSKIFLNFFLHINENNEIFGTIIFRSDFVFGSGYKVESLSDKLEKLITGFLIGIKTFDLDANLNKINKNKLQKLTASEAESLVRSNHKSLVPSNEGTRDIVSVINLIKLSPELSQFLDSALLGIFHKHLKEIDKLKKLQSSYEDILIDAFEDF
ncbi:NACHT domain-containing protein [Pseudoalteromonas sp. BZB3]|uniref:NACHT domain-containing protein n=1 Tax=Pseudoalteromonas sp. BZB3 TaxID=3136670 RepID=UPI0032C3F06D